jgi:hypothetical protein
VKRPKVESHWEGKGIKAERCEFCSAPFSSLYNRVSTFNLQPPLLTPYYQSNPKTSKEVVPPLGLREKGYGVIRLVTSLEVIRSKGKIWNCKFIPRTSAATLKPLKRSQGKGVRQVSFPFDSITSKEVVPPLGLRG